MPALQGSAGRHGSTAPGQDRAMDSACQAGTRREDICQRHARCGVAGHDKRHRTMAEREGTDAHSRQSGHVLPPSWAARSGLTHPLGGPLGLMGPFGQGQADGIEAGIQQHRGRGAGTPLSGLRKDEPLGDGHQRPSGITGRGGPQMARQPLEKQYREPQTTAHGSHHAGQISRTSLPAQHPEGAHQDEKRERICPVNLPAAP